MSHASMPASATYTPEQAMLYQYMDEDTKRLQDLIQTGSAWQLEGCIGRACMDALRSGQCFLGARPYRDPYGNRIPSFSEVEPGTTGSLEFVEARCK